MQLYLYNTFTRKKEEFKPLHKNTVSLWTCGPTVYYYAHIGNLRTYLFEDFLKRTLLYNGYQVKHVMNITDVGHLTSDADTGEDKVEQEAQKEGKSAWDIAAHYTQAFQEDLNTLNILPPTLWCKATDYIHEQITLIQTLEKKGYTYIIPQDGVYFDTSKFKDYGTLANLKKQKIRAGARIKLVAGKRNPTDFALWKFSPPATKRHMEWKSPWAEKGFPGWHIECSAMSMKHLGTPIDIHCGGMDHIGVHHTNEIAQSEAATGTTFVHYWMHGAFLTIKEGRMGKSVGNMLRIEELEQQGYDPLDYRYLCLTAHYNKPLEFSIEALNGAKNSYNKLKEKILHLHKESYPQVTAVSYHEQFLEAINDDLNMPRALAVMWDMLNDKELPDSQKYTTIMEFDKILGLNLQGLALPIPTHIKQLAEQREQARKKKDWKKADALRKKIEQEGYLLEDKPEGHYIKPKHL